MRSRILSLWLPNLPTDRLRRRARPETRSAGAAPAAARPLVTYDSLNDALRLAAIDPVAAAAGLRPGMMLADARALVPALEVQAAEPERDLELLGELARWCERYTPHVAIDRSFAHQTGGALWLDIRGCAHLFGGEAALRDDLLRRLCRQGFAARAAIADHPGTAWAVARYGDPGREIVPSGGARIALAPLPVAALRLPPDAVSMLERLGLACADSLYPLPRQALAARFGDLLTRRLDQALGQAAEPISPQEPRPGHRAEVNLAEPLGHTDGLVALTRRLVRELCLSLEVASAGARRLTLAFFRVDNTLALVTIGTSRPCREPRQLLRLFQEKLETVDPGFGIERALLEAEVVEPLLPEPIAWRGLGAGDLDQARDLAPLVDRLSNRLGREAVARLVPRESHLPERAQRRMPALAEREPAPFPARRTFGEAPSRPLRLLIRPEPVEAVAPLPDEPPVLFRWRRVLHRIRRVAGPERLAPEWWRTGWVDPDGQSRDYFAVEDEDGCRFWLFREGLYLPGAPLPRWYLHGLFA
jgi:protein ImuB